MSHHGTRAGLISCAALAAMLLVAACTSSNASHQISDPPSPGTSSASHTTSAASSSPPLLTQTAEAQAIASYLGMWKDFAAAGHTSDWKSPLLSQYATGDALLQMSRGLYADHLNGYITKGAPVDHPTIKSATPTSDPTTVLVSDCGDSSHWLKYVAATGRLVPGTPGGRQAITAEAKRQSNGTWKVDRFAVEAVGTCA